MKTRDFPGGPVVESSPCNSGDSGIGITHAMKQLGLCTTATEACPFWRPHNTPESLCTTARGLGKCSEDPTCSS